MFSARSDAGTAMELAPPVAVLVTELLHEMGQPLTTLQACRLMPLLAAVERDALASEMADQVERVTELYRELRSLLEDASTSSDLATRPSLREFLHGEAVAWESQAERRNVTLLLKLPEKAAAVGVSGRAERAIRNVVGAAVAQAPPGGQLRLLAYEQPEEGRCRVLVEVLAATSQPGAPASRPPASGASASGPPARASIGLRVAEALLESEGGRVVYNLQPFRATIELSAAETLPCR